ncbi:hypothetical protein VE00_10786 [Pseudogymnoascus sp. WSF 3629]|nr:hypothetical protein VE00_10786 [Pseudogymnoascus sp. WSF 3629]
MDEKMPGIADEMAQMKIASPLPVESTYGQVSTSSYSQAISYTSANTLSYGSQASAPNPTNTLASASTSMPTQAARKVEVISYKVDNDMCWAFELDGVAAFSEDGDAAHFGEEYAKPVSMLKLSTPS